MGHSTAQRSQAQEDSQRGEIARLLREAKARGQGVKRADLIFSYHFTQCGTRIFELEQSGWKIEHRLEDGQRYVTYFLLSEPAEPKPLPPFQRRGRELEVRALPLFANVESQQ